MKITVTGDLRMIANSAWISTMDEIRANKKTDEDVDRVTSFLAKNMHTSPFECVTLSVVTPNMWDLSPYYKNNFCRFYDPHIDDDAESDDYIMTLDLWNFAKITIKNNYETELWKLFKQEYPKLSEKIELFNLTKIEPSPENVESELGFGGQKNINVEIVSVHSGNTRENSRATWRIKCPLSIAVQILRHRSGSFNMVSGRYKTIKQENAIPSDDIINISKKIGFQNFETEINEISKNLKIHYSEYMYFAKNAKNNKTITNLEYKRFREFTRFILPEGRLTELYATFYLNDFDNFLKLRDSAHAQIEHVYVAQQMKKTLESYDF